MISELHLGSTCTMTYKVPRNKLVRHLFPELPEFIKGEDVFATGYMVGLLEAPCRRALYRHVSADEVPVGDKVAIVHCAPTIPGMTLTLTAVLVYSDGRSHEFHVIAVDDQMNVAAQGRIGQKIVSKPKFRKRLARLAEGLPGTLKWVSAPHATRLIEHTLSR